MRRMKDRPSPIYEIHDYISNVDSPRLKIPGFIKKYGTTPYEINLYIPSLLLPLQNNDAAVIEKITIVPCYSIGNEGTGSLTMPVYVTSKALYPGVLLYIDGSVDGNDLLLDLRAMNLITGIDITQEYHQTFFEGFQNHDGMIIMYSLNEISTSIRKIKDSYR